MILHIRFVQCIDEQCNIWRSFYIFYYPLPEDYQPNKKCIWHVTFPVGFQVALNFKSFEVIRWIHFSTVYVYIISNISTITIPRMQAIQIICILQIENHDNRVYDHIEIRDGGDENSLKLGAFCGYKVSVIEFYNNGRLKHSKI